MRSMFITGLAAVLLVVLSAQAAEIQPRIDVTGTATIEVVPDTMVWSVRVITRGKKLEEVAAAHTAQVENLIAYLDKSAIAKKSIQMGSMSFEEDWDRRGNERTMVGYIAITRVAFDLTKFGEYRKIWRGLATMPGIEITSVGYTHSEMIELRKKARKQALLAARDKASVMAGILDAKIGRPLLIDESGFGSRQITYSYDNVQSNSYAEATPDGEDGRPTTLGTIAVRVSVDVSFELLAPEE